MIAVTEMGSTAAVEDPDVFFAEGGLVDELVKILAARLARKVGASGRRYFDPEDLQQEMRLRLFEQRHRFDPSVGRLPAFIRRVASSAGAAFLAQIFGKTRHPEGARVP